MGLKVKFRQPVRPMRIKEVDITNFRALCAEQIAFNDYTCLVGPNGAGKSTLITALKIFFRDSVGSTADPVLKEEDFHLRDTSKPIVITVKFCDLGTEAQKDFAHYYRQGLLIVSAVAEWDATLRSAQVKQFGQRMGMEQFAPYFKADQEGASATDLKKIYEGIRTSYTELPSTTAKGTMKDALRSFEASHAELCTPIRSEDQFYGFSKGTNLLEKYVQWVCVPAVKDATTEQLEARNNALKTLLERTVRSRLSFKDPLDALRLETEGKYREILKEHQAKLESLSESLSIKLKDWAHPDANLKVQWHDEPSEYVNVSEPLAQVVASEGRFAGSLSNFGHGFQRSFLLALLQELAGAGNAGGPKLLLACEEPELYQHPPQARHLASALEKLSTSNSQVLVSTHSPYFISGRGFEDVRIFRPNPGLKEANIHSATFDELAKTIAKAIGEPRPTVPGLALKVQQTLNSSINEMFFASALILVEGPEDAAYIKTYITLTDSWDEFRRLGCHIVPCGGKNSMIQPLAIAKMLGIPTFAVFDADGNDKTPQHERDNLAIMRLSQVVSPEPFPSTILRTDNVHVWPTKIGSDVRSDLGENQWSEAAERVRTAMKIEVRNLHKNPSFIGYILVDAWEHGARSDELGGLCEAIISFATDAKKSTAEH